MKLATRLDAVVSVKERQEEKARKGLAEASSLLQRARLAAEAAKEAALKDQRQRASAEDWQLLETAHVRALEKAKVAAEAEKKAQEHTERARSHFVETRRSAEVVRRVAESRRQELRQELARAERRETDAVAGLLFAVER